MSFVYIQNIWDRDVICKELINRTLLLHTQIDDFSVDNYNCYNFYRIFQYKDNTFLVLMHARCIDILLEFTVQSASRS